MIGVGKMVAGVLAVTTVTVGVGVATAAPSPEAVVQRIVDGDTFEAGFEGRTTTVRLLNVDTPETKDPNADVECLGPEAASRLAQMIPVGSTVRLAFDDERTDGYDRTLAGVYDGQERLVNAEIAREGLGVAALVGGNDRFYDDVVDAQDEARANGRGLYATDVACTVPARVENATTAAAGMQATAATAPSDPADLDRAAQRALGVFDEITRLESAFTGPRLGLVWTALSTDDDRRLTGALASAQQDADGAHRTLVSYAASARETARLVAEQAERDRVAREEQARQAERAAREAEQVREAEQRRRETAAAPADEPPVVAQAGAGSGCDPNYSPCVPISSKDLDCDDLPGSYLVIGSDPHRLDNDDADDVGCEANG